MISSQWVSNMKTLVRTDNHAESVCRRAQTPRLDGRYVSSGQWFRSRRNESMSFVAGKIEKFCQAWFGIVGQRLADFKTFSQITISEQRLELAVGLPFNVSCILSRT